MTCSRTSTTRSPISRATRPAPALLHAGALSTAAAIARAAAAGFALAGCTTYAVPAEEARPVPPERVLDARFLVASRTCAQVVVVRDSGSHGADCAIRISVDDHPVASLEASEKVALCLAPGAHAIGATRGGTCVASAATVAIQASAAGAAEFLRTGISGDSVVLAPAPP